MWRLKLPTFWSKIYWKSHMRWMNFKHLQTYLFPSYFHTAVNKNRKGNNSNVFHTIEFTVWNLMLLMQIHSLIFNVRKEVFSLTRKYFNLRNFSSELNKTWERATAERKKYLNIHEKCSCWVSEGRMIKSDEICMK